MKRALPLLLILLEVAAVNTLLTAPARADCASEIRALRAELAAVKDERRRQELLRLIEKAEKDDQAGRDRLCGDATQHARALLKG
jgi:hypothetical protein